MSLNMLETPNTGFAATRLINEPVQEIWVPIPSSIREGSVTSLWIYTDIPETSLQMKVQIKRAMCIKRIFWPPSEVKK